MVREPAADPSTELSKLKALAFTRFWRKLHRWKAKNLARLMMSLAFGKCNLRRVERDTTEAESAIQAVRFDGMTFKRLYQNTGVWQTFDPYSSNPLRFLGLSQATYLALPGVWVC
jgi:hypothetical protein